MFKYTFYKIGVRENVRYLLCTPIVKDCLEGEKWSTNIPAFYILGKDSCITQVIGQRQRQNYLINFPLWAIIANRGAVCSILLLSIQALLHPSGIEVSDFLPKKSPTWPITVTTDWSKSGIKQNPIWKNHGNHNISKNWTSLSKKDAKT